MQIKDAEQKAGMSRANIRYYEKEGLLNRPLRNENNYREYTEDDVEQLRRIRILRLLEVPVDDIRKYRNNKVSFCELNDAPFFRLNAAF